MNFGFYEHRFYFGSLLFLFWFFTSVLAACVAKEIKDRRLSTQGGENMNSGGVHLSGNKNVK